jgi:hypothetical protein
MELLNVIPYHNKLVIFDMFGTLVVRPPRGYYGPREHVSHLLSMLYQDGKITALSSDAPREEEDISELFSDYPGVYPGWSLYFKNKIYQGEGHLVSPEGFSHVKDLAKIMSDCGISNVSDVVMIGNDDSGRDSMSAKAFGIDFILVKPDTDFSALYSK